MVAGIIATSGGPLVMPLPRLLLLSAAATHSDKTFPFLVGDHRGCADRPVIDPSAFPILPTPLEQKSFPFLFRASISESPTINSYTLTQPTRAKVARMCVWYNYDEGFRPPFIVSCECPEIKIIKIILKVLTNFVAFLFQLALPHRISKLLKASKIN